MTRWQVVCFAWDQVSCEAPEDVLECLLWFHLGAYDKEGSVCVRVFSNCCAWVWGCFCSGRSRDCVQQAAGRAAGCDAVLLLQLPCLWLRGQWLCLHPSLPSPQHHEPLGTTAVTPCPTEVSSSFVTDSSNLVFGQNASFLSILLLKMLFLE